MFDVTKQVLVLQKNINTPLVGLIDTVKLACWYIVEPCKLIHICYRDGNGTGQPVGRSGRFRSGRVQFY